LFPVSHRFAVCKMTPSKWTWWCCVCWLCCLCNVSFREHLLEDDHDRWPKHSRGCALCNSVNFAYPYMNLLVVSLIMNHQCVVMNHLKL